MVVSLSKYKIKIIILLLSLYLFFILFSPDVNAQGFTILQNFSLKFVFYEYFWNSNSVFNRLSDNLLEDEFKYNLFFYYNIYFVSKSIQCFLSLYGKNLLDISSSASLSLEVLQVWAKINIETGWSISFGRKFVKWQEGIFVNPSDLVNNQLYFGDVEDISGKDLLEILGIIEIFGQPIDINIVFLFYEDLINYEDIPVFFNFGTIIYPFETKIKIAVQNKKKPKFASTSNLAIGDFQIYYDIVYFQESEISFVERSLKNYFQYIIGLRYDGIFTACKFIKGVNVSIEYYHRDDGLTKAEGESFYSFLSEIDLGSSSSQYLNLISEYEFFIYYKNYIFADIYIYGIISKYLDFEMTLYYNIEDNSFLYNIQLFFTPKGLFVINIGYLSCEGILNSEVMQIPYKSLIYISFSKNI